MGICSLFFGGGKKIRYDIISLYSSILPRSLTQPLQNSDGWKMNFLLGRPILRAYVKLHGGIFFVKI